MAKWLESLRRLGKDEGGNIALLFGLTLVPMMGATGAAIDYAKASNMRTALQAEADAAALDIVKAAVEIHTAPANVGKTPAERQTMIDSAIPAVLASRSAIAATRASLNDANFSFTGGWADNLKTEYRVVASSNVKKYFRHPLANEFTSVASSATARMEYTGIVTTTTPTIGNPGYEAGDYNRIYAYCYNKNEPNVANRRTKMTAVSSNGTHNGVPEMSTNTVFQNVSMPVCDADKGETLSWRLYNVRGQRTTMSKWPIDHPSYSPPSNYTAAADATGVQIFNHYSDTILDPITGVESYQFRGDAHGYPNSINMMETFVCESQQACTPGGAGSVIPSQTAAPYNMPKNRNPNLSGTKCEAGKFMYIGWEDRPFLQINNNGDYSTANSHQWTDSDYDDIRLVISCPQTTITGYTSKISLIK
jgi:Flp pilus assembly protein TadG